MALWRAIERTSSSDPFLQIERLDLELLANRREMQRLVVELRDRGREMRSILDSVDQGLVVIGSDGQMSSTRSAAVERMLGKIPAHASLVDSFARWDPNRAEWLDLGLESLRDGLVPTELVLEQLPKRTRGSEERALSARYIPLDDTLDQILVVLSDVSAELEREREHAKHEQLLNLLDHLVRDRSTTMDFVTEASRIVQSLQTDHTDREAVMRSLHTLKGNAAAFGLDELVATSHEIESELVSSNRALSPHELDEITCAWWEIEHALKRIGARQRDTVEVDRDDYDRLLARLADTNACKQMVNSFRYAAMESIGSKLEQLAHTANGLAAKLGKPSPNCIVIHNDIRVVPGVWVAFFSSLVHVVRNAMSHGIESTAARVRADKAEAGTMTLAARLSAGTLIVEVGDDGAGIDWERIRQLAIERGLSATTRADLIDCVFSDGVSTETEATEISGRGVGMSAVKEACDATGGQISIDSKPGIGTTFQFVFDVLDSKGTIRALSRQQVEIGKARAQQSQSPIS